MKNFIVLIFTACLISLSSCAARVEVQPAAQVTFVRTLPSNYKIVRVHGKRYYYCNGHHYRKTSRGYVIVRF
jgi:hypothetical protein